MFDVADWTQWGLWGLFLSAFLAGTVLAFGSEAVLVALLVVGVQPVATVAVATAGNVLGALSVVALGRLVARGKPLERPWLRKWVERAQPRDPERLRSARERLERWGPRSLLLSWVPVIGDALVFAAGALRLGLGWVFVYLALGKFLRYAGLAWAVVALGWGDSL